MSFTNQTSKISQRLSYTSIVTLEISRLVFLPYRITCELRKPLFCMLWIINSVDPKIPC